MNERRYALGRLSMSLHGSGQVAGAIAEEVRALPATDRAPSLRFATYDRGYFDGANAAPPAGDWADFTVPGLNGRLTSDGAGFSIECEIQTKRPLKRELSRFKNRNFVYRYQEIAKSFWYDVFDWCTQIANLDHGQSWVHASGVSKDGVGTAIMAQGGVGKTTAMLKLCTEHGYSYLSDDLALVDDTGLMYRSPKKLQVYAYNIAGQPRIAERLLAGRSALDRFQFQYRNTFYGPKFVRRRVAAEELFGEASCGTQCPITNFVFLERHGKADFEISEVSATALARRMAPIVMDEIAPFTRIERHWRARGLSIVPDSGTLEKRTEEVLERCFATGKNTLIKVGKEASPDALAEKLLGILG